MRLCDMDPFSVHLRDKAFFRSGFFGSHKKTLREYKREPEHLRPYAHTDPARSLDWRLYAKTEELNVRQVFAPAQERVLIEIDAQDSMHWPDEAVFTSAYASKFLTAKKCGFALAYAHLQRMDKVYIKYREGETSEVMTLKSRSELRELYAMNTLTDLPFSKNAATHYDRHYVVSDLINPVGEIFDNSFVIHLLSVLEAKADALPGEFLYYDTQSDHKDIQGEALKKNYHHALDKWIKTMRDKYPNYVLVNDHTSVDEWLMLLESCEVAFAERY
jgi:hypothetical protein